MKTVKTTKSAIVLLLFILALSFLVVACKNTDKPSPEDKGERQQAENIWTDENELIKIWQEKGKYHIAYDLEKWDEIHNIYEFTAKTDPDAVLQDRVLLMNGLTEEIQDVVFFNLPGYGGTYHDRTDFPLVYLLMESGEIMWFRAYPPRIWFEDGEVIYAEEEMYVGDYLPHLKNIASFSYESTGEGIGGETMYAVDKDGLKYDLSYIMEYEELTISQHTAFPTSEPGGESILITLRLSPDGTAALAKVINPGEIIYYHGAYTMHLDDSSSKGHRAPGISLDLSSENASLFGESSSLVGNFFLGKADGGVDFYRSDGDFFEEALDWLSFRAGADSTTEIEFDFRSLTSEEIMEYFLAVVPGLRERMEKNELIIVSDGSDTELVDYGYCRDVFIGRAGRQGGIIHEVHCVVTDYGIVFEYNPATDLWDMVSVP